MVTRPDTTRIADVWVNKRIDASFGDWWVGLRSCLSPGGNDPTERVERLWDPEGAAMAGLSVRSLFDLWLSAQGWSPGDRIVFTAFTIDDMPRIAREHGLEVAAVDIDPLTCEPDLAVLRALIGDRTQAIVYTHLFGARGDVTGALRIAEEAGVLFVEDCAEAYAGPHWRGHPASDLALFSFGPIKSATAFGGGLARISDPSTRTEMRRRADQLPELPTGEYAVRLLKYGVMMALQAPRTFGLVVRVLDRFAGGHDEVLNGLSRSYPGPRFLERIRRRPNRALLKLLDHRLRQGDAPVERRRQPAARLVRGLSGAAIPTAASLDHSYWLVPVLAENGDGVIERLAAAGYHATRGRAFAVVEHDGGVQAPAPTGAIELFEHAVYLPFDPDMPESILDDIARLVVDELAPGGPDPEGHAAKEELAS